MLQCTVAVTIDVHLQEKLKYLFGHSIMVKQ